MLPNLSSIPISLRSTDNCLKQLKMVRTSQHSAFYWVESASQAKQMCMLSSSCELSEKTDARSQSHVHAATYVCEVQSSWLSELSACMAYAAHHHQDRYLPQVVLQCMPACKIPRRCLTGSYIVLLSHHHMYTSRHDDPRGQGHGDGQRGHLVC